MTHEGTGDSARGEPDTSPAVTPGIWAGPFERRSARLTELALSVRSFW